MAVVEQGGHSVGSGHVTTGQVVVGIVRQVGQVIGGGQVVVGGNGHSVTVCVGGGGGG